MAEALQLLGLGNLKDIANACIYLLSDASRWVTGSYLVVDGGGILLGGVRIKLFRFIRNKSDVNLKLIILCRPYRDCLIITVYDLMQMINHRSFRHKYNTLLITLNNV